MTEFADAMNEEWANDKRRRCQREVHLVLAAISAEAQALLMDSLRIVREIESPSPSEEASGRPFTCRDPIYEKVVEGDPCHFNMRLHRLRDVLVRLESGGTVLAQILKTMTEHDRKKQ